MYYEMHITSKEFKDTETHLFGLQWEDDDRPAYDGMFIYVDDSGDVFEYKFEKLEEIDRWVLVTC